MNTKLIFMYMLLFCATFLKVSAQEAGIIKGVVMEKGAPNRIAAADIVNKKTQKSVKSNDFGLFQIAAVVGDTLLVYKQNYQDLVIVVATPKDIAIYLTKGVTTLDNVTIYGQTKKQEMNDIKREFRNKGSFYAGKPPLLSYVFTPLTAIYELFGRTPKNARRFNNYYNSEMQQTQVDQYFNQSIIQKHTDLTGKDLETFMLNYRPDYEVVQKWAEYDALKYIQESYKKFKTEKPVN